MERNRQSESLKDILSECGCLKISRRHWGRLCLGLLLAVWLTPQLCFSQRASRQSGSRRIVTLAVSVSERAQIGTQQKWLQMLQDVGADRVTSRTDVSEPSVEEIQAPTVTTIQVTGLIYKRKLHLPGGSFSINDKAGIRALLKRLKDDGSEVALAEKKAFGLTAQQLVELHGTLSREVEFETADQNAGDVIKKIAGKTGLSFEFDAAARAAISGEEKVVDELKGISSGTALATILRPLGLVLEPQRLQGKKLTMRIIDSRSSKEHWPIGWPIEKIPFQVVPQMFNKLPIEIRGFPMKTAVDAIQKRAGMPYYYDLNALAREGIEMDKVKVSLSSKKISLMLATTKLLRQSKPQLWEEVRIDENGAPFLWITTRK